MKRLFPRVRKSIRDCDWMKKFPYEFFMRSILSENLSKYEIKITSSYVSKQLVKKAIFLYFSTEIAGKILVTAECSLTRNAEPPPGTETPVKGTVKMFQLVRC